MSIKYVKRWIVKISKFYVSLKQHKYEVKMINFDLVLIFEPIKEPLDMNVSEMSFLYGSKNPLCQLQNCEQSRQARLKEEKRQEAEMRRAERKQKHLERAMAEPPPRPL